MVPYLLCRITRYKIGINLLWGISMSSGSLWHVERRRKNVGKRERKGEEV